MLGDTLTAASNATVSTGCSLQDSSLMVQVEVASSTLDNVINYARNLNQVQIEQPKPKRRR